MNRFPVHRRRPSPLVWALLVVLLPTLIACGGTSGSPAATTSSTGATAAKPGGERTTLPRSNTAASAAASSATTDSSLQPADRNGASGGTTSSDGSGTTAGGTGAAPPAGEGAAAGAVGAAASTASDGFAGETTPPSKPGPAAGDVARHPHPQSSSLKAGEVDDNVDFVSYLNYLQSYHGPRAQTLDIRERLIIQVTDQSQRPVYDARVQLFEGRRQVFEGRTYADGRTLVLPHMLNIDRQSSSLELLVEKDNQQVQVDMSLYREQTSTYSVVLPNAAMPPRPRLDILFLLDATGSMSDEIQQLQQSMVSIAERIDATQSRPEVNFGLVAYRDRGDDYVTRVYDFTPDVQSFRSTLLQIEANGGGDEPESLNEALHDAIHEVQWSDNAIRLIFLVADAPPHLDYPQDYDYLVEVQEAVTRGIKIFPIAASNSSEQAEYVFRQLAQQTLGTFIFLTYEQGQNAGTPGESTVHNVDPSQFTVERLDDLVVQVIERELGHATGR